MFWKRKYQVNNHVVILRTVDFTVWYQAIREMKYTCYINSSGGRVVKFLACGAREPGFDSRPRHLNFPRWVISCFHVAIWLKHRWSHVNPQYNQQPTINTRFTLVDQQNALLGITTIQTNPPNSPLTCYRYFVFANGPSNFICIAKVRNVQYSHPSPRINKFAQLSHHITFKTPV